MRISLRIFIITLLCISNSFSAYAIDGVIKFLKGTAFVNGIPVKQGHPISFQDKIKTNKNSLLVLKIKPGVVIKIKSETSITIKKPFKTKKGNRTIHDYLLIKGQMFIKAKRTRKNRFRVKANSAIMGVRGTQFFVTNTGTNKENKIWMCVNEGQVSVRIGKSKNSLLVNKGEGIFINSNKLPVKRAYEWTKKLNWKNQGSYKEINDKLDINNIKYNSDEFDYD